MRALLDEACSILDDFETEIAGIKVDWDRMAMDNPNFEPLSFESWQAKYHRMWLHGATDPLECNELERWLTDYPPSTAIANTLAKKIYDAWRDWLPIAGREKVQKVLDYDKKSCGYVERESQEPSEAFYSEDARFEIPLPLKGEILFDFIKRLARWFEGAYRVL